MDKLTDFFKLLSDETRLRILILLFHKKFCVCELCGIMGEAQPKISKHLGKLRDMGFVKDERQEQFIYYKLNITEGLYMNILQEIINNINDYATIKEDLEKSGNTKLFLESCKNKI
ncbi:MAG: putative transcriptional regulator [Clostridiales bacterium]|nr:putative transcriptional regulator [Clostridiales bacterium]